MCVRTESLMVEHSVETCVTVKQGVNEVVDAP